MNNADQVELIKNKVIELIRHASQARTCDHARQDTVELLDIMDSYRAGQVLGNWMSIILITGEAIRITLKLHFSNQDIRTVAYPIYGAASPAGVSDIQSMDFVKELCNLTAGYLVQIFESVGIPTGISLPLGTRGFYEVFADYQPNRYQLIKCSDLFALQVSDIRIAGTAMIEISNASALEAICSYEVGQGQNNDDEEFDFL
jgi:hypothetical protein